MASGGEADPSRRPHPDDRPQLLAASGGEAGPSRRPHPDDRPQLLAASGGEAGSLPSLVGQARESLVGQEREADLAPGAEAPRPFAAAESGARTASAFASFAAVLMRELRLSVRHGADTVAALLFFLLTASLFPLAIGPAPETLGRMAPGIVWVCALLAALLPLDRQFGADWEDGSLDLLLLCGLPAAAIAGAKAAAHWLVTGLPLLLAAAPLAVMLRMPDTGIPVLLAGLVPGTLLLSLLGTTAAAVVLGARRGGVLLPLLVLPLVTPVLIFGAAAADAASGGLTPRPHLLFLAAMLAAALPFCPIAAGAALRAAME